MGKSRTRRKSDTTTLLPGAVTRPLQPDSGHGLLYQVVASEFLGYVPQACRHRLVFLILALLSGIAVGKVLAGDTRKGRIRRDVALRRGTLCRALAKAGSAPGNIAHDVGPDAARMNRVRRCARAGKTLGKLERI